MNRVRLFMPVLACLVVPAAVPAQDTGLALGTRPPTLAIEDLDGHSVDFAQWIGRKPLLVEFWAIWCDNCEALLPRMLAAHQTFGDRVEFVAVAVAVSQSRDRVRRYATQHGMNLRILYDTDGAAVRAFQAPVTSYVVVLDEQGRVAYTGVGADQQFEPALRQVAGARE